MRRHKRFLCLLGTLAGSFAFAVAAAWIGGFRWNMTRSYPQGLWRQTSRSWKKGDLVLIDVPSSRKIFKVALDRHYLSSGFFTAASPLLKRVVAVPGDRVTVDQAVSVNGQKLANSTLLATDREGRPLPREACSETVAAGNIWVMSDFSGLSFDSRYFGPLSASFIRGRVQPVWTW